jgi:hypothetical protein
MASIRQMANCIGLSGEIWLVKDFYGYWKGGPKQLSLLKQVLLLKGKHIHLNLIRVGIESFTNEGKNNDEQEINLAVQFTRDTYATVNLGIGRVERYEITTADAEGREHIDSDGEARELTRKWTVDNDALDVFFVLTYTGITIGLSKVDGSCNKHRKSPMTGSVVAIEDSPNTTGFVLAHEVGHYLGLSHSDNDSTNLMFPVVPNGGNLTSNQGNKMREHCFVDSGC